MKYLVSIIIASFLVLFLTRCAEDQKAEEMIPVVRLDRGQQSKEILDLGDLVSELEIVPLENSSNVLVGNITKIISYKNHLLIMDQVESTVDKIYIFNQKGEFMNLIHDSGKGPGEYLEIEDFCINIGCDEIVIVDARYNKMLFYSFEGEFIEEIIQDFEQGQYYGIEPNLLIKLRGRFISGQIDQSDCEMIIFNRENERVKSFFPFGHRWEGWKSSPNELFPYKDKTLIHHPYDFTLYELDKTYNLIPFIQFDPGNQRIDTTGLYDETSFVSFHTQLANVKSGYMYKIGHILASGKHLLITRNIETKSQYIIIDGEDFSSNMYLCDERDILGFSNGWPIPFPTTSSDSCLIGFLNPFDLLQLWEKYPEMRNLALKSIDYAKLINKIDVEGNPLIIKYKIQIE